MLPRNNAHGGQACDARAQAEQGVQADAALASGRLWRGPVQRPFAHGVVGECGMEGPIFGIAK